MTLPLLPSRRPMSTTSNAALRRQLAAPEALDQLRQQGWTVATGPAENAQRLTRDYKFENFVEAWGFMSRVAIWAEKLNVRRPVLLRVPPCSCSRGAKPPFGGLADINDICSTIQNGRTSTTASRSP